MKGSATSVLPNLRVQTGGGVPSRAAAYARKKVLALTRYSPAPIPYGRIRLTKVHDPANNRSAVVQVNLDVDGHGVRAQAAAPTFTEAIDLVQGRLRERLRHVGRFTRAREWTRRTPTTDTVPAPPVEVGSSDLVRHKTYAPEQVTPEEAAFDMELMDYDFFLFRDATTGRDSVVFRDEDGSTRMLRLAGDTTPSSTTAPFPVSDVDVPVMSTHQAIERLAATGERFVFFADAASGRGHVVYRRYDGRYGLISPA